MKKKTKYIIKKITRLFLIIAITIIIYQFYINLQTQVSQAESQQKPKIQNTNSYNSITEVLENNFNSVVGVSKLKENGNSIFLMNASEDLGLGTGMVISKKGYILTNQHVSGDKECYITLSSGNVSKGKVVWSSEENDLSIVKITERTQYAANLGNSDDIQIGESVYAIGNPIGYEFQRTVTGGIISALNRTVKLKEKEDYIYMANLIQTDATINPGNSGGPLINQRGEVIGINTVKITSAEGIGFAIPINMIKPIIQKLETTGEYKEAYLGVFAYDASIIPYMNANTNLKTGVYVETIYDDGPASQTELKTGDIITKIDNREITKMSQLQEYIYSKNPGETVNLVIDRSGREKQISITLEERNK